MVKLIDALERFNRKERNLLIRMALLGETHGTPILNESFLQRVASKLGLKCIPQDAWWATDYHISWLAGALALYADADKAKSDDDNSIFPQTAYCNPNHTGTSATGTYDYQLIEGNQEDIDLVIAFDRDLILIEAKAFSPFVNSASNSNSASQIDSKLERLQLLHDFYVDVRKPGSANQIRFHFLLTSPGKPGNLDGKIPTWINPLAPNKTAWMRFRLPTNALKVTRFQAETDEKAQYTRWRIVKAPRPKGSTDPDDKE